MSTDEYAQRRTRFFAELGSATAIIPGAKTSFRNADTEYEFRQNSDFFYLTGFPEPDAVAVFQGGESQRFTLFVRPRDRAAETWTGRRYGVEGARSHFAADEAWTTGELAERLPDLLLGTETLAYHLGDDLERDRTIMTAVHAAREKVRRGGRAPENFSSPQRFIHEARLHKSATEIATLRRAAAVTAAGFAAGMAATRPQLAEFELEAIIEGRYRALGAQDVAYPSIVAGGLNATILHYNTNRDILRAGDLVLVDSGCECDNYASDVTRTWPVNGRFSAEQRALYEIVLAAQTAALEKTRPGEPFDAYHTAAVAVLTAGLCDVGILHGSIDALMENRAYAPYYMHRTGHWMGLDVHDAGRYTIDNAYRPLENGMVLTVEPGLYIAEDADVPAHFRGIGIRIEDDILITADGYENLTAAIPRSIDDLETVLAQGIGAR